MNKQNYLITYICERRGTISYAIDITNDRLQWLVDAQNISDEETYFIIHSIEITEAEAKRYDGELKGM